MIRKLVRCFPARVVSNDNGFTLVELLISMFIVAVLTSFLVAFIATPSYEGTAYTIVDGQKYYNLVHLPEKGIAGGVCAGMAYKWGISPWVPRLGFIVLTCCGGAGVPIYLVVWALTDSAHAPGDYLIRTGG